MKRVIQTASFKAHSWMLCLIGILCVLICAANGFSAPVHPDEKDFLEPGDDVNTGEPAGVFPVYLYFSDSSNKFLIGEERPAISADNPVQLCRMLIIELIKGPQSELAATLPPETQLRAVYITPDKTAYVDLNQNIVSGHSGGIVSEQMTIYSIVNTLVLNVSDVDQVKLLIEGQEAETLAGHIDIRFPLSADMLLIR